MKRQSFIQYNHKCTTISINLGCPLPKMSILLYIIQQTWMPEDLDATKAPPVMRHIIRELVEPAGLNL